MNINTKRKIAVISCGVLEWNIEEIIKKYPDTEFIPHYLPAQLHNNPQRLRAMLQEVIDEVSTTPGVEGIGLGFGVCGRGTIGIYSRQVPLVIPRAQDCLGILLGSHSRYVEEFTAKPGTRYLSRGWYDKTVKAVTMESYMAEQEEALYNSEYEELKTKYGDENARFICSFRESWKNNYQRAAYIRFPAEEEEPPGALITQGMAQKLDWEHEILAGDESLLEAMLSGNWQDSRLLVVPPHHRTVRSAGYNVIGFTSDADNEIQALRERYEKKSRHNKSPRTGIGLGLDTGGTYTDAVIYDFQQAAVIASTKVPTTHGKLEAGIKSALFELPENVIKKVEQVGISTTLATNAFIERKGRPVALLLMSPFEVHTESLPFQYVAKIAGGLNMEGEITSPLDPDQVKQCALMAVENGCEAFAISGFGSVVNPEHELKVAAIAYQNTGLHAVCGHELTSNLNFIERATTAAMNAKLIPLIEELLQSVRNALASVGLPGQRIMVLKGDGSQMLDKVAEKYPVETVLSGPAASVVGAGKLFQSSEAVVADMGGTTLDVAVIRNGLPVIADKGARVGDFQTSVNAMAMRTIGLGGDSEIDLSEWPSVSIGPRRVMPVCRLPDYHAGIGGQMESLSQRYTIPIAANVLDVVSLQENTDFDEEFLNRLKERPFFLLELAELFDMPLPAYLPWVKYETNGVIRRFALTLTDVLHITDKYNAFHKDIAELFLRHWGLLLDVDPDEIVAAVQREFKRRVINEILAVSLPEDCPWDKTEAGLRDWLTHHLAEDRQSSPRAAFTVSLSDPILPVGAPTPALFPQLKDKLNTDVMISQYASVANAFGAVAAEVVLRQTARIRITEDGALLCSWADGKKRAGSLSDAVTICEQKLMDRLQEQCREHETSFSQPAFSLQVHEADAQDGKVLLG
ncbi:MAG: DUF1638 domain-containing protein, partial [Verrucomicrobiota bacterium]